MIRRLVDCQCLGWLADEFRFLDDGSMLIANSGREAKERPATQGQKERPG